MGTPHGRWPLARLHRVAKETGSLLCVGLDPDPERMPKSEPDIVAFCRSIIEATRVVALAYKINFAYFEALGRTGWDTLYRVRELLPDTALLIADAKRGDIAHSAERYAHAIFQELDFDALTVSPYMGSDSVAPFLAHSDRWVFVLGLTSNPGSADLQQQSLSSGKSICRTVLEQAQAWPRESELGFVVGATHPTQLADIRTWAPFSWFLVPGIGVQGGSAAYVLQKAATPKAGVLLTASRSILYASKGLDFGQAAGEAARSLAAETYPFSQLLEK